jgi:3-isopropylmalate/(R)-2-methylmalate dehydratase small subunit
MRAFSHLTGKVLVLPQENIDTDQIIPARFLTATRFEGLGEHVFADWRRDGEGRLRDDCPLNEPRAMDSPILVAGRNFGCGSSREHAPFALMDFGFRVVISSEIADIFRNNSLNIGLLPIVLPADQHARLLEQDGREITVDLEGCTVEVPAAGGTVEFAFEIDGFGRHCLLRGMDRLDFLLSHETAIKEHEDRK